MKNLNLYKIFAILFIAISVSCVDNNDYELPTLGPDKNYKNLEDLATLTSKYQGDLIEFELTNNNSGDVVELNTFGYVVSDDRSGNFYRELFIQDKPENPTVGVILLLRATNLSADYNVGRKVYIRMNGLALDKDTRRDAFVIGVKGSRFAEAIQEDDIKKHVERSNEITQIVPTVKKINELTSSDIATFVTIEGVQSEEKGVTYANIDNTSSVNRTLITCDSDDTIILRTSGFANFKSLAIPARKGNISAVLGSWYGDYQLFLNTPDDMDFTEQRCDPIFEDGFANFDNWTLYSVTGDEEWIIESRFGVPAPSAKISGYNRGSKENEDWLISKAIDLSSYTSGDISFSFTNVKRFSGNDIEVFYSTNYNGGNPNDAANTWTKLEPTLDTNTGSWSSWTNSGNMELSNVLGGDVYVAFKYTSTTSAAATFEIDNVKVSIR